jgi:hypothetical protein
MRLLLILLLLSFAAGNENMGAKGFYLGGYTLEPYVSTVNLTVNADPSTLIIYEVISTKDPELLTSTLRFLTDRYGAFRNASQNYEDNLKVFFKVMTGNSIVVRADKHKVTITYRAFND